LTGTPILPFKDDGSTVKIGHRDHVRISVPVIDSDNCGGSRAAISDGIEGIVQTVSPIYGRSVAGAYLSEKPV
jgi:hypothetical protein